MFLAYFYALVAAIFWGVGFIGSRYGLEEVGPIWLTFLRFAVAFIAFLPVLKYTKKSDFNFKLIKGSFLSSNFLALLIVLQIAGLQYTTVAKSGFITILYAFFVPLITFFIFKKKISSNFWVLLAFAFAGMLLISEFQLSGLNYGDFLTLICAFCSAGHIISISFFSKKQNVGLFNLMQLFFVSLMCFPLALYFEGVPASISTLSILDNTMAIGGVVFVGVFSTSVAFFLQVKSQQKIPAHMAGLIFLLESPLAAILGFMAFNESMSAIAIAGSVIVITSVALMPFDTINLKVVRNHAVRIANIFGMLAITLVVLQYI